jgi:hypothetical protein
MTQKKGAENPKAKMPREVRVVWEVQTAIPGTKKRSSRSEIDAREGRRNEIVVKTNFSRKERTL